MSSFLHGGQICFPCISLCIFSGFTIRIWKMYLIWWELKSVSSQALQWMNIFLQSKNMIIKLFCYLAFITGYVGVLALDAWADSNNPSLLQLEIKLIKHHYKFLMLNEQEFFPVFFLFQRKNYYDQKFEWFCTAYQCQWFFNLE